MSIERPLSELIIRDLMFETLKDKEFCKGVSGGYSFFNGARTYDLYWIMELKAINKKLITEEEKVNQSAWGADRRHLIEKSTTNFQGEEINSIYEAFYLLLNNGIIAPGVHRRSSDLPCFHITKHGKSCLDEKEILPYDIEGFTEKIISINEIDEWVKFYLIEALRCYNARCYNATTVMIGLSSEKLVELLIRETSELLGRRSYSYNNNQECITDRLKEYFDEEIRTQRYISSKYTTLMGFIDIIKQTDSGEKEIKNLINSEIDKGAIDTFVNFIRLNRNEVSHCTEVKKDATETMMLLMSIVKFCEKYSAILKKIRNS